MKPEEPDVRDDERVLYFDFMEYVLVDGEWWIEAATETGCPVRIKVSPERLIRSVRMEETSPLETRQIA